MSTADYNIPMGFHFAPSDSELISYLTHKLKGGIDDIILSANVFDIEPPWQLFERYSNTNRRNAGVDKPAYFYSLVNKKGNISLKNFDRTVGDFGTWKVNNKGKDITDPKNKSVLLGTKRKFNFDTDCESSCKWLMTEYSLAGENKLNYPCASDDQDFVICKIRKKIDSYVTDPAQQQQHAEEVMQNAPDEMNADIGKYLAYFNLDKSEKSCRSMNEEIDEGGFDDLHGLLLEIEPLSAQQHAENEKMLPNMKNYVPNSDSHKSKERCRFASEEMYDVGFDDFDELLAGIKTDDQGV